MKVGLLKEVTTGLQQEDIQPPGKQKCNETRITHPRTARCGAHKKNMKRSCPMSLEPSPSCMHHHAFMRNKPLKILETQ